MSPAAKIFSFLISISQSNYEQNSRQYKNLIKKREKNYFLPFLTGADEQQWPHPMGIANFIMPFKISRTPITIHISYMNQIWFAIITIPTIKNFRLQHLPQTP